MDEKVNWLELAKKVLEETKKPTHVNDMATSIKRKAWTELTEEEIAKKLSSALAGSVKRSTSDFKREKNKNGSFKKGIYALKPKRKVPIQHPVLALPDEEPVGTDYIGKGGEFGVLSELLFRGYNASIMTVDDGIDIVASKNNKYFHIQVKTATHKKKEDSLRFSIKGSAFKTAFATSTFYVLVVRKQFKDIKCEYLVFPNSIIHSFVNSKMITVSKNGDLSINLTANIKGEYFIGKISVHSYLGQFDSALR